MVLFSLFIVAILLFGSYYVGPLSLRVYLAISMILYIGYRIVISRKTLFRLPYKVIFTYILFLIMTFIAKTFSGPFELDGYLKAVLSYHVVCIVCYVAVDLCVTNRRRVRSTLMILVGICLLNSIVTLMQYNGNELGLIVGHAFSTSEVESIENITEILDSNVSSDSVYRYVPPGIFQNGASNGYNNTTLCILILFYFFQRKSYLSKLLFFICFIIGVVACFYIQERAAMAVLLLGVLYIGYKFSSKNQIAILIVAMILFFFYTSIDFNESTLGRYVNMLEIDPTRLRLWNAAFDFISEHWLWGGERLWHISYLTPHNFVLHTLIYSGILGAAVMFYLFIRIVIDAVKCLSAKSPVPSFFFAVTLLMFLSLGFTHSGSLTTGEALPWIFYAMMLRSKQLEKNAIVEVTQ